MQIITATVSATCSLPGYNNVRPSVTPSVTQANARPRCKLRLISRCAGVIPSHNTRRLSLGRATAKAVARARWQQMTRTIRHNERRESGGVPHLVVAVP